MMVKYDAPLGLENNNNLQRLIKRIKKDAIVLEFGPSTGRLTKFLVSDLHCKVYGVEIDEEAYAVCQKYLADGICGDIEDYSWKEKFSAIAFDYVIFADVLEHLHDPERAISEVKPFLKDDGEILVSVPNIAHNSVLIELLQGRFDYMPTGLLDNTHIHFFTMNTCREMFEECGYSLLYSDGTMAEPYNTEIGNSFSGFPESVEQYLSSRDYGNLYQMIFAFGLTKKSCENHIEVCRQREYYAKVYFDLGHGIVEENHIYKRVYLEKEVNTIIIGDGEIPTGCLALAVDPLDNYASKNKLTQVYQGRKELAVVTMEDFFTDGEGYAYSFQGKWKIPIGSSETLQINFFVEKMDSFDILKKYFEYYQYISQYISKQKIERKKEEITLKKALLRDQDAYQRQFNNGNLHHPFLIKCYHFLQKLDKEKSAAVDVINIGCNAQVLTAGGYTITNYQQFLAHSQADYVVLRFHQAKLFDDYFDKMIKKMRQENVDVLFSDCKDNSGNVRLKGQFSFELLTHQIQEYDALCIKADIYNILASEFTIANVQNSYELMLELTKVTNRIERFEEPMYQVAEHSLRFDHSLMQRVQDCLAYTYDEFCQVKKIDDGHLESVFGYSLRQPKISIIIPMKDKWQLTDDCVQSILHTSTYQNYEILILNNNSEEDETYRWFEKIRKNEKVKVIEAAFEFNWSRLNNYGIDYSDAEIFIFLNNDTLVITPNWMERLCDDAMRDDSGVCGALLMYEDQTIQHAGVVVGMNDFADHIYKQEQITYSDPLFLSPLDKRNILAVTGACMAISRKTIDKIGKFNDQFIICGSDVEICIRAYKQGLHNIYDPSVRLYHLESKSRDTYIPPIDFEMSIQHYAPYRENGDPYFNHRLSRKHTTPKLK